MNTGRKLVAAIARAGLRPDWPAIFPFSRPAHHRPPPHWGSFTPRRRQPWQPRRPKAGRQPYSPSDGRVPHARHFHVDGHIGPVSRCDAASFVRDVTVPDGTKMEPGDDFTKTWRLLNAGTCSWTTAYRLVL